jgi:hypothetical protein
VKGAFAIMTYSTSSKPSTALAELALVELIARDVKVLAERQASEDASAKDAARAKMSARAKEREAAKRKLKLQRAAVPPVTEPRRARYG